MDDETEVIKQQMAETRESLAEKLDTLEHKVIDTVEGATHAVTSTVDSVSGAVHSTVDTVRSVFDITGHVERHPWGMLCGSIALGFLGGYLLGPSSRRRDPRDRRWPNMTDDRHGLIPDHLPWSERTEALPPPQVGTQPVPFAPEKPGFFDKVADRFEPALDKLREVAIGAGANIVGKMILSSVPPGMRPQVAGVIDEFAAALGGKPEAEGAQPPAPVKAPSEQSKEALRQDHRHHNRLAKGRGNGRTE